MRIHWPVLSLCTGSKPYLVSRERFPPQQKWDTNYNLSNRAEPGPWRGPRMRAGAFELDQNGGSPIDVLVSTSVIGGRTIAVLTFAGSDIIGGSLADGSYILTLQTDRIHDRLGRKLDGDCDGTPGGNRVDSFFRL